MRLLVGCPISMRAWIMQDWFNHVYSSCRSIKPNFIFAGNPETDPKTWEIIYNNCEPTVLNTYETTRSDVRVWNADRYHLMVSLRNTLLSGVRQHAPELFLSLDSDVLLHPDAVNNLIDSSHRYDAVGGKVYMSRGIRDPSFAIFNRLGNMHRPDFSGVCHADVIMGIKMMTPSAYAVDYRWHQRGEDVGWSKSCKEAGVKLGFDGRITNKHIMAPAKLNAFDPRAGW